MRPRHDDPDLPDDVQAKDLDKVARNELRTLSKDNAEWVARHLVMAGRLLEEDPDLAHRHVLSAARRAGRIAVVRESLAISAYATGDFALALRELRTYRRISGSDEQVPLMVDSERGVGRPDKALELGRSVDRSTLSPGAQVSLAIAMSGARLDLGQGELALMELEIPQLDPDRAFSYSPDLFAAYALVLEEVGRAEEAAEWQRRADIAARAVFAAEGGGDDETIEVVEEEGEYVPATRAELSGLVAADAAPDTDAAPEADLDDALDIDDEDEDEDDSLGPDSAELAEQDAPEIDQPLEIDEPLETDEPAKINDPVETNEPTNAGAPVEDDETADSDVSAETTAADAIENQAALDDADLSDADFEEALADSTPEALSVEDAAEATGDEEAADETTAESTDVESADDTDITPTDTEEDGADVPKPEA
ncbi:hypothetical protein [Rathayibacter sp. VKM Ac-2928]|uniref:hypothetical protein n=1 Tax=Rathayibacter sp. VKM Ac-2928 TaxID=2929479 RepID=UPI001FB1C2F7|nr:hypothetical protein [Rathayibacter sp. VKM Ac-2928]MCJ1685396.1 hypothetical protein [Rathayibacter sp. VKM Ac-2928]